MVFRGIGHRQATVPEPFINPRAVLPSLAIQRLLAGAIGLPHLAHEPTAAPPLANTPASEALFAQPLQGMSAFVTTTARSSRIHEQASWN